MEIEIHKDVVAEAFIQEGGIEKLLKSLESQVKHLVFDMNDKKSREDCRSLAYKISRSKTAVDDYGKELVADAKEKIKVIDNRRKLWRDCCDEIRDSVRAPLDAYEAEIKAKEDAIKNRINEISSKAIIHFQTIEEIDKAIETVKSYDVSEDSFGQFSPEAKLAKYETLEKLDKAKADLKIYIEKVEAERQAMIAAATADAERRAVEAEKRAAEAEDRAFREIQEREERKAKDKEHARVVHRSIVDALCQWGALDEDQSKDLVRMISKGEIPHISIKY